MITFGTNVVGWVTWVGHLGDNCTAESCRDIRPGHTANTTHVRLQQHVDNVHKTIVFGIEMIMTVADRGGVTGQWYVGRGGVVCGHEPHLCDWRHTTLCCGAAWAMCTGVGVGHERITWKWGRNRNIGLPGHWAWSVV